MSSTRSRMACARPWWVRTPCCDCAKPPSRLRALRVRFGTVLWYSRSSLTRTQKKFSGKVCVELGAGCGLVSAVLCGCGGRVVSTDLKENTSLLQANLSRNVRDSFFKVVSLPWGSELDANFRDAISELRCAMRLSSDENADEKAGGAKEIKSSSEGLLPDIVFGADLMYTNASAAFLVETLEMLCPAGSATEIFFSYGRNRGAETEFFESAKNFEWNDVAPESLDDVYQCEDVRVIRMVRKAPQPLKEDLSK
eukprot:Rmarinus@m.12548